MARLACLLIALLAAGIVGCAGTFRVSDYNEMGVKNLLAPDTFERIDDATLIKIVDPLGRRNLRNCCQGRGGETSAPTDASTDLERALYCANFYNTDSDTGHRNGVQARLMATSDQICNRYKTVIKRMDTWESFTGGSLATVLGGLGAIFTNANTVRALSGSAAIVSGIDAQFQASFLANLASEVIVPGIDQKRGELVTKMEEKRKKSIKEYPVQEAIRDAIDYHGACTLTTGISVAAKEIQRRQIGVGIDEMVATLDKVNLVRAKSAGFDTEQYRTLLQDEITKQLFDSSTGNTKANLVECSKAIARANDIPEGKLGSKAAFNEFAKTVSNPLALETVLKGIQRCMR